MLRIPADTAFLDRTEVTVGDYSKCVERGLCTVPALKKVSERWLCTWVRREAQPLTPVDCVSRDEAASYCVSIGKRLPSRAEWLRALKSQHPNSYLWEKGAPELDRVFALGPCWGTAGACAVPHFEPEPARFADLVGNVQEWAAGAEDVAEVLGLGWSDPDPHDPELLQVDRVRETRAAARSFAVGFRCARSAG
jgi:formylglycine-generating enzyme required for sulfatase activity